MNDLVLVDTDVLIDVGRDIREAVASLQQVEQLAIPADRQIGRDNFRRRR